MGRFHAISDRVIHPFFEAEMIHYIYLEKIKLIEKKIAEIFSLAEQGATELEIARQLHQLERDVFSMKREILNLHHEANLSSNDAN